MINTSHTSGVRCTGLACLQKLLLKTASKIKKMTEKSGDRWSCLMCSNAVRRNLQRPRANRFSILTLFNSSLRSPPTSCCQELSSTSTAVSHGVCCHRMEFSRNRLKNKQLVGWMYRCLPKAIYKYIVHFVNSWPSLPLDCRYSSSLLVTRTCTYTCTVNCTEHVKMYTLKSCKVRTVYVLQKFIFINSSHTVVYSRLLSNL